MNADEGPLDAETLERFGEALHAFMQKYPNNYACVALVAMYKRGAAGEYVDPAERELALRTLVQLMKWD